MLEIKLPDLEIKFVQAEQSEIDLLCLGGKKPVAEWLQNIPSAWSTFCADRGGEYAASVGRKVNLLVGDQDSAGSAIYNKVKGEGGKVIVYPSEKDFTDTQLLLQEVANNPCHLIVTGAFGGRLDHLQSNIRTLVNYKKTTGKQVVLVDGEETLILLQAGESCALQFLTKELPIFSFLPLEKDSRVSGTNLKWPVENFTLNLANPNAISNVLLKSQCEIKCHRGLVGIYLYRGKNGIYTDF